ncbi:MAG: hypothetical protein OXI43_12450 [Candidatus Poribacteria bacterium]|nr:hypothetical protein [Candidatus Poribacteria bacterium]
MNISKVLFFMKRLVVCVYLVCSLLLFMGCETYEEWRNDPPEINTFTVPKEVRYGETVELGVSVLDPENDTLTYTWVVSDGELSSEDHPEVEWTAPALPKADVAPDQMVRVHVTVRDDGEESAVKSETITVYSKAYRVAKALSGSYELIRTEIAGTSVEEFGSMRLTTTTFTREFQSNNAFEFGTYQLIEPFDAARGTIYWYTDDNPEPLVSTYTWDGELFVVFHAATATGYIYQKRQ